MSAKTVTVETLRRLLWRHHGHGMALYGDDGEMQCHECGLDYLRATDEEIEARWADMTLRAADEWVPDVVRDATDPPTDAEGNPATLVATYVGLAVMDVPFVGDPKEQPHPEAFCERCKRPNLPAWWIDSALWNATLRGPDGSDEWDVLCPQCFAEVAESKGIVKLPIWELRLDKGRASTPEPKP